MPSRTLPTPVLVALAVLALLLTGGACALCLMPWGPATEEPQPTPATQWPAPGASLPGLVDAGPSAADEPHGGPLGRWRPRWRRGRRR